MKVFELLIPVAFILMSTILPCRSQEATVFAFLQGPKGLKWGISQKELVGNEYYAKHPMTAITVYKTPGVPILISSTVLKDVQYTFWKEQLIQVSSYDIKDETKVLQMAKSLEERLGKADWVKASKNNHSYSWTTGQEDVLLYYFKGETSKGEGFGAISFISHQVSNKKMESDKQNDKVSNLLCDYRDFTKECYDSSTVKLLPGNIVRVTIVNVHETQEHYVRINKIVDIHCLNGTSKRLYSSFYMNGRLKKEEEETDDWTAIRKNSFLQSVSDSLCNK